MTSSLLNQQGRQGAQGKQGREGTAVSTSLYSSMDLSLKVKRCCQESFTLLIYGSKFKS